MLGFPLLYFKGMRLMMFQLSGFYYRGLNRWGRVPFQGVWKDYYQGSNVPTF